MAQLKAHVKHRGGDLGRSVGVPHGGPHELVIELVNGHDHPVAVDLEVASNPSLCLEAQDAHGRSMLMPLPTPPRPDRTGAWVTLGPGATRAITLRGFVSSFWPSGGYRFRYKYRGRHDGKTDEGVQRADEAVSDWVSLEHTRSEEPGPDQGGETHKAGHVPCIKCGRCLGCGHGQDHSHVTGGGHGHGCGCGSGCGCGCGCGHGHGGGHGRNCGCLSCALGDLVGRALRALCGGEAQRPGGQAPAPPAPPGGGSGGGCNTVASREVAQSMTEVITEATDPAWNGTYGWTSKFKVTVDQPNSRITVLTRIKMIGATEAQQAAWAGAIEQKWGNAYKLCCQGGGGQPCCINGYTIVYDLQWVTSNEHYVVYGAPSTTNMLNWGLNDLVDTTHEVGHMLGSKEEYYTIDGVPWGAPRVATGSIMNNPANFPFPRHYDLIAAQALLLLKGGITGTVKAVADPCQ
jgi:hypothetical protein